MTQGQTADDGALLVADGVTLQYKTADHLVTATWRVGFEVFAGERFVVLGPYMLEPTILQWLGWPKAAEPT